MKKVRELRKNQTSAEKIMWELLKNRKFLGLKFRRQHQIGQYVTDFYCTEKSLVIELDGEVHDTAIQMKKDVKRNAYLHSVGNTVLRFKNNEIFNSPEVVLKKIAQTIESSPPERGQGEEQIEPSPPGRGQGEGNADRRIGVI